jgi:hypothetical protein
MNDEKWQKYEIERNKADLYVRTETEKSIKIFDKYFLIKKMPRESDLYVVLVCKHCGKEFKAKTISGFRSRTLATALKHIRELNTRDWIDISRLYLANYIKGIVPVELENYYDFVSFDADTGIRLETYGNTTIKGMEGHVGSYKRRSTNGNVIVYAIERGIMPTLELSRNIKNYDKYPKVKVLKY